jgi:hypothetical protein
VDDQVLVNVLKAQLGLDVYAASVQGVRDKLKENPAPLKNLADVLEEAVEFLSTVGVRGPGALPYAYQLVTLAALAARFRGKLAQGKYQKRLETWFWVTTYTEYFTGSTGNRIRDGIEQLALELKGKAPARNELTPVQPLTEIRMSTVRARAFLLFLAQLPPDPEARMRRQEWLGTSDAAVAPSIFSTASGVDPGNRVIAGPTELRVLRAAIRNGQVPPDMADEFAIPQGALDKLPDSEAFVLERSRKLVTQEKTFIESFGLELSDSEE